MNTDKHGFFSSHSRRRQKAKTIWSAVAERSGDTAFRAPANFKSGVALRFPPQFKTFGCDACRATFTRA
ncbi:MAG: hypothetical protein ABSH15_13995 [Verrucomicrobiota bacterium]|jgi:hypothetical protein